MKNKISLHLVEEIKRKFTPKDDTKVGFGNIYTDHMFKMDYFGGSWHNPRIEPYRELSLSPAAMGLHYAQLIFEGMKGYRHKDNSIALFRPQENLKRLNRSAERVCIPAIDEKLALEGLKELLKADERWVPSAEGTSLYIRPTVIATEPHLGVRPSKEYLFYIICSPVAAYYAEGFAPIKIYVEEVYSRAAKGGLGEAKAAANYVASLYAAEQAIKKGYSQLLWLDAATHTCVEEVGSMNMFFVIGDELITSQLSGTILPGITRKTVLEVAKDWNLKISERDLSIDEIIEANKKGTLKESFGSGTAAVISPVGSLTYRGQEIIINNFKTGDLTQKLYDEIVGIQTGLRKDKHNWVEFI